METPQDNPEYEQLRFSPEEVQEEALKAFLSAADALSRSGELTQAELRYRQALRQAELAFGESSDQTKRVLSIMTFFYRFHNRDDEAKKLELRLLSRNNQPLPSEPMRKRNLQSRFLRKAKTDDQLVQMNRIVLPPEIKKACQTLGLPTEEEFVLDDVLKAWKKRIVDGSVHPDLGGEEEHSILLNTSKDVVIRWLESRLPKFGKPIETFQIK